MDKDTVLTIMTDIRNKKTNDHTIKAIETLMLFVLMSESYDHQRTIEFIEGLKSPKLGGYAIDLNKTLEHVKLELKSANKHSKKILKDGK